MTCDALHDLNGCKTSAFVTVRHSRSSCGRNVAPHARIPDMRLKPTLRQHLLRSSCSLCGVLLAQSMYQVVAHVLHSPVTRSREGPDDLDTTVARVPLSSQHQPSCIRMSSFPPDVSHANLLATVLFIFLTQRFSAFHGSDPPPVRSHQMRREQEIRNPLPNRILMPTIPTHQRPAHNLRLQQQLMQTL